MPGNLPQATRFDNTAGVEIKWSPVPFHSYTCQAACRAAPTLLLCYSVIVLWFANTGHKKYRPTRPAWYLSKNQPSFADIIATARQTMLKHQMHGIFKIHPTTTDQHNLAKTLLRLIKLAA